MLLFCLRGIFMKVIFKQLIIFTIIFTIISCATLNPEMLQPEKNQITKKLLPLKIGLSDENIVKTEAVNTTTYQSEPATLFERELEANIFQQSRDQWGFIEFKTTFDDSNVTFFGVVFSGISLGSLFVANLIGLPPSQYNYTKEVEISIFDSNKVKIKKYTYLDSGKYFGDFGGLGLAFYYKNNFRILQVKIVKNILNKFRYDIEEDVEYINSELRKVGSLK